MTVRRPSLSAALTIACLALATAAQPAFADSLQDASKLLKQGQQAQALEQIDRYLAGKPKDPQGRFLRGVILTEMGRSSEAIGVFTKLTEDYPELPEPYNNLAVIYAQQKQYEKAKQALEMAIRTHPSYATAHENLGDLYARMASQAYDRALQLDSSNASAQAKLSLIRDLMSTSPKVAAAKADTTPLPAKPAAEAPKPVAPPAPTVIASTPAPAPSVPAPAAKPEAPKAEAPKAVEAPKAAEKAQEKTDKAESKDAGGNDATEINKALEAWASAWSKKDVKGYLARYAKDFKTPNGESRNDWENERSKRITKPGKISVAIENVRVTPEGGDHATVKFRQHYKSASLSSSSNKVLAMVKRDGKWLIQQERIGN